MSDAGKLAAALKAKFRTIDLHQIVYDDGSMGSEYTGWMSSPVVDWDELDKEIDAFCAEFKK